MDWTRFAAAVFDCDGVLLDSNRVKGDAFATVLAQAPPVALEAFERHRQAHPGASRHSLLRHFYETILPADDPAAAAGEAAARFAALTRPLLVACPEVPGASALVEALQARGLPLAVISAAAQDDLVEILSRRGLASRFAAIRGGDASKQHHAEALLAAGVLRRPLLWFGDSRADLEAAEAVGAHFICVTGASEWRQAAAISRGRGHQVVADLADLACSAAAET